MSNVRYDFTVVHETDLAEALSSFNRRQDKIISVTQYEGFYTIFYEVGGNKKDGES